MHFDTGELGLLADRSFESDVIDRPVVLSVVAPLRNDNPRRAVQDYVPLITWLHDHRPNSDSGRIRFEMNLYTSHATAFAGVLSNEVDFLRAEPAGYINLRQAVPSLTILAAEEFSGRAELRGVIFTRTDSGITQLEQLRGRSIALGASESAIGNYLPKAALVRAGLRASDLTVTNLADSRMFSAVGKGQVDAGVAFLDDFVALTNSTAITNIPGGLRIIENTKAPPHCWIATRKLDPAVARALSDSLLGLRATNMLVRVDHELTRFVPANPGDYDTLEKELEAAKLFSAPRSEVIQTKP